MSSKDSYLSSPRCQCDFVVATTQASINSNLLQYLDEEAQPIQYLCFASDDNGYPTEQISLDDLRRKGVDPFIIPDDATSDDPNVQKLAKETDFAVGVMMQMGMPIGYTSETLPPIVTLNSASNVTFNLFCRQVKVISIKWGKRGTFKWNVFKQPVEPPANPWCMKMSVDLTMAGLDRGLNTNYLNSHPKIKDQLKKALENMSSTAFSLQQLMFDLDSAILQTVPDFSSVNDEDARHVLETYFRDMYVSNAKEHGLPLVSVTAVDQSKDRSPLKMTGFERIVNRPKDSKGNPSSRPTEAQLEASTLDYLCVTGGKRVPNISDLDWNWVSPEDVNDSSGAMSINRDVFAQYISSELGTAIQTLRYRPRISPGFVEFLAIGAPYFQFPSHGPTVMFIRFQDEAEGIQEFIPPHHSAGSGPDGPEAHDSVTCNVYVKVIYNLDVILEGSSVRVVQHSELYLNTEIGSIGSVGERITRKTLTDTYGISVDQLGGLQLVKTGDHLEVDPLPDGFDDWLKKFFGYGWEADVVVDLYNKVKNEFQDFQGAGLHELQVSQIHNFVFPGGRVFTYKEPFFSDYQDLVCKITYLDPEEVSSAQTSHEVSKVPQKHPVEANTISPDRSSWHSSNPLQISDGGKLTACTELMQNYVQGEIVSPTDKFEALQTSDGHTLLFSCDTSGIFHAIEETSGSSHTGWHIHDLSTKPIATWFPGQVSRAKVRTFDVGQSALDGTIGLMMAVSLDGNDHLFVSLGNSSKSTSWLAAPEWTIFPFDPANDQPQHINILGCLFAETHGKTQYLVVDISRPSSNVSDSHIRRYHIDPSHSKGHYWVKHDVTVDISGGQYQSAVGRVSGKHVDGVYTASHVRQSPQLVYEPIINWYGSGPPAPIRLRLPGGAIPSAIATVRDSKGFSDLYAVAGSSLYRFAADEQGGDFEPDALVSSNVIVDTDTLRGMTHAGVTTIWGRSRGGQVYYLTCKTAQLSDPNAWVPPFAIASGVERMSTYVNCTDGGNTIFTSGSGGLKKIVQDSTATGATWRPQQITVEAGQEKPCTSFKSYTTTIHVTQKDKDVPAPNSRVMLSAHSRIPVYINGIYYVLSPKPIQVVADSAGCLTIIDTATSLNAAVLTASLDTSTSITVDPMDRTINKLTAFESVAALRSARFPSKTVSGGILESTELTPLVDPSASDDDLAAAVYLLGLIKEGYDTVQGNSGARSSAFVSETGGLHNAMFQVLDPKAVSFSWLGDLGHWLGGVVDDFGKTIKKFGNTVKSWAGDIWQGMKNGAVEMGKIIKDAATGTLHFVAQIGGTIYHAVLNTVHAIVGAVEWLWDKIKTGFNQLVGFLEALLHWDDIRRTKDVIHNVMKLWLQHQVDYIPVAKERFDGSMAEFKQLMKEWTKSNTPSSLSGPYKGTPGSSAANPNKGHTSSSKLLATHYQNNAHKVRIIGDSPTVGAVEQLINDLLAAVSQEGKVLEQVLFQLQGLASDFPRLTVDEVLRRMVGILIDTVFSSVQVVVDALLNTLYHLAQSTIRILDTKIHIPIISDILKDLVPSISFLDLICWIAAMGFTVVYEIIEQKSPFPNNDHVRSLITAKTWEELQCLFGQSDLSWPPKLPLSVRKPFFKACHAIAAFLGMIGNPISSAEAASEAGSLGKLATGATVIKIVMSGSQAIGDLLVPRYPIKNSTMNTISKVTSAVGIVAAIVFSETVQKKFKAANINSLSVGNPRGVGAIAGVILILPRIVVIGWHFYELSKTDAGETRTAAILGEVSSLASCVSTISYMVAVNDEDPDSRLIA
ncbi:hypothetical protein ACLX1H_008987 [Fusarium chlamydosporum]